jgi:hypothetical protein
MLLYQNFMGADMLNLEKLRENWMHVNETKNLISSAKETSVMSMTGK